MGSEPFDDEAFCDVGDFNIHVNPFVLICIFSLFLNHF